MLENARSIPKIDAAMASIFIPSKYQQKTLKPQMAPNQGSKSLFGSSRFQLTMTVQCDQQDDGKCQTENDHTPVNKPLEC
jgi:predicted acetyltransferase